MPRTNGMGDLPSVEDIIERTMEDADATSCGDIAKGGWRRRAHQARFYTYAVQELVHLLRGRSVQTTLTVKLSSTQVLRESNVISCSSRGACIWTTLD